MEERPKRAIDKDDLSFGDLDLDRIPDKVLDLEAKIEGLAVRKGRLASRGSSLEGDRVFRTSSAGRAALLGSWPADPSPCEVMDYGSGWGYLAVCRVW